MKTNAKYDRILDLELAVKVSRNSSAFQLAGVPDFVAKNQATSQENDRAKLAAAIAELTVEEMREFGQYRIEATR